MADSYPRDNSIFREVSSKSSIRDVISYELGPTALVKVGKYLKCICPFHNDHSPSMQVNVEKNTFHCFVDGKGGDPITFVSEYEHISKIEALKKVCQICNIPLPEGLNSRKPFVPQIETRFKEELKALEEVGRYYQACLESNEGEECRRYLEKRGIPKSAVEHFQLGYAPKDASRIIRILRKDRFDVPILETAGILSSSSELKDRFSHRLMYPIYDDYGHLVGFSGRKIDEETPGGKYVNYPATQLFVKSEILYHYHIAKNTCHKDGYLYIVEGFNDVIAFQRAGIESVVGSMGTALTKENIQSLKRLNVQIRLCLDRDEPGQVAEEECLPLLSQAGLPFMVVRPFKTGKDADEVLYNAKEDPGKDLQSQAQRMYDPFLFLLARALKKTGSNKLTDSLAISSFLKKAGPYYAKLDEVARLNDLKALQKVTEMPSQDLQKLLENQTADIPKKEYIHPKKEYHQPYRAYGNYRKEPLPINMVNENNLTYDYKVAENINEFITQAANSIEGSSMLYELVKNEAQIIYVLPHCVEACQELQSANCDLRFQPFYALSILINEIYLKDNSKRSFDEEDFKKLSAFIKDYPMKHQEYLKQDKKESEDDFGFDMEGIDLQKEDDGFDLEGIDGKDDSIEDAFSININPDDLEFLSVAIEFLSRSNDKVYARENFLRELKIHPLLSKYDARMRFCRENNLSIKTDKELRDIYVELLREQIFIKR